MISLFLLLLQFFSETGDQIEDKYSLTPGEIVYVVLGEDFSGGKKQPTTKHTPESTPTTNALENPDIQSKIVWWSNYRYAQLRFLVDQGQQNIPFRGILVKNGTEELGNLVANSHLSIPELRELILGLRSVVEDEKNGFAWGFHSASWETGRSTSVAVVRVSDGRFRVE